MIYLISLIWNFCLCMRGKAWFYALGGLTFLENNALEKWISYRKKHPVEIYLFIFVLRMVLSICLPFHFFNPFLPRAWKIEFLSGSRIILHHLSWLHKCFSIFILPLIITFASLLEFTFWLGCSGNVCGWHFEQSHPHFMSYCHLYSSFCVGALVSVLNHSKRTELAILSKSFWNNNLKIISSFTAVCATWRIWL